MSEKYTIVQHEKRLFWLQDCPVLLHSYALTKNNTNNSIFLQCKFENIADKPIKAMNIAVKCSDVSHQELANVDNFPYLDINVQPYTLFGDKTPVALPNNTTRNVRIIPLKVIFSDDTTWENTSERAYELAEYEQQPISSLGELADQYKRDLHKICTDSEKHNYLPANVNGFTVCGCGKVVLPDTQYCASCGVDFSKLFAINNSEILHTEQPLVTAFGVGQHAARRGAVNVPAFQQKADEPPFRHLQLLGGGAQVGAVPQVDEQVVVDGFALQPGIVLPQRRVFLALSQQVGAELQQRLRGGGDLP